MSFSRIISVYSISNTGVSMDVNIPIVQELIVEVSPVADSSEEKIICKSDHELSSDSKNEINGRSDHKSDNEDESDDEDEPITSIRGEYIPGLYAKPFAFSLIIFSIPQIVALVIAAENYNLSTCSAGFMSPALWLICECAFYIPISMLSVILNVKNYSLQIPMLVGFMFDIVWSSIGSVVIWSNNPDCEPFSLRFIASLIIAMQFVGILLYVKNRL
jgi:hypothetical protein